MSSAIISESIAGQNGHIEFHKRFRISIAAVTKIPKIVSYGMWV